jgi:two-component sensor histidine kinase
MSYVAASSLTTGKRMVSKPVPPSVPETDAPSAEEIDIRQLRHHTKNTLQRLIGLLSDVPGLTDTPAGEKLARELEYKIQLSAEISNALFGLTSAPGSMAERLRNLAGAMVELMRDPDQVIRTGVSVKGCCPPELREAVVRTAHELIGNAMKHGMKGRTTGRIAVRLVSEAGETTLTITDNGWGFEGAPKMGEGLALAHTFAEQSGGSLELDGADGTVATLRLPH